MARSPIPPRGSLFRPYFLVLFAAVAVPLPVIAIARGRFRTSRPKASALPRVRGEGESPNPIRSTMLASAGTQSEGTKKPALKLLINLHTLTHIGSIQR